MITLAVFVLGYLYCLTQFPGFASTRVICNILTDNAFLGIIAVGMTFVILSGGIDLSVGSVIAFTGVFLAKAIGFWGSRRCWPFRWYWPWAAPSARLWDC